MVGTLGTLGMGNGEWRVVVVGGFLIIAVGLLVLDLMMGLGLVWISWEEKWGGKRGKGEEEIICMSVI